jgi:hypothetical protein
MFRRGATLFKIIPRLNSDESFHMVGNRDFLTIANQNPARHAGSPSFLEADLIKSKPFADYHRFALHQQFEPNSLQRQQSATDYSASEVLVQPSANSTLSTES